MFDLLLPFAESSDARLRGNAAHAYAALLESSDPVVSERAREQIISIVGSTSTVVGDASPDWERRFSAKVLDAYAGLKPDASRTCRAAILDRSGDSDSMQQSSFARFFLTLNTHTPDNRAAVSWFKAQRLMWRAGRPGFGSTLLAAGWRWLVVYLVFSMPLYLVFDKDFTNESIFNICFVMSLFVTIILALLHLPGHFWQSRTTKSVDVVLTGLIVAAGTMLAAASFDGEPRLNRVDIAATAALGFTTGILLAWRRWLRRGAKSDLLQSLTRWEPIIALCVVTLLCLGAAQFPGTSELRVGLAWGSLAPTAIVVTWVYEWASGRPPRPLVPATGRRVNAWLVIVPALSIVAVAGLLAGINIRRALTENSSKLENKAVKIPGELKVNEELQSQVVMGIHYTFDVTQPSSVRFSAMPVSGDQMLELHVTTPMMEIPDPSPDKSSANTPAVVQARLDPGTWRVCTAPADKQVCDTEQSKRLTKSFPDFVQALMGRPSLDVAISKLRPTLRITYLGAAPKEHVPPAETAASASEAPTAPVPQRR